MQPFSAVIWLHIVGRTAPCVDQSHQIIFCRQIIGRYTAVLVQLRLSARNLQKKTEPFRHTTTLIPLLVGVEGTNPPPEVFLISMLSHMSWKAETFWLFLNIHYLSITHIFNQSFLEYGASRTPFRKRHANSKLCNVQGFVVVTVVKRLTRNFQDCIWPCMTTKLISRIQELRHRGGSGVKLPKLSEGHT